LQTLQNRKGTWENKEEDRRCIEVLTMNDNSLKKKEVLPNRRQKVQLAKRWDDEQRGLKRWGGSIQGTFKKDV
jgi:hypothetical protein